MTDEDVLARLRRLAERLDDDVVFAMSHGSKELFHGNLLGWYLKRFRDVRAALLDAWQVSAGTSGRSPGQPTADLA